MAIPLRKPPQSAKTAAQPAKKPVMRTLKKGDTLFKEGDHSRSMYFVKSGMIRIFKKKGDSAIELDTIRAGQIIGELAFLDGNPRSASAEALTTCELTEIGIDTFSSTLKSIPDWLKIMLKTVVARLRSASTRIRQLESASTSYSNKDGKRTAGYVYLSSYDVLKVMAAILLVTSRNGKDSEKGVGIKISLLQRYANQVMGIPVAKITTVIDLLAEQGMVNLGDAETGADITVIDADGIESFIAYLNEENIAEPSKRHDLTDRGFVVMSAIAKTLKNFKKDESTGMTQINVVDVINLASEEKGSEAFKIQEAEELYKLGYISSLSAKSTTEVFCNLKEKEFEEAYGNQKIVKAIEKANQEKSG